MNKLYEFKDSLLESIKQDAERVSINLRAIRSETECRSELPSALFRQEIQLLLDGAELFVDSTNLPSWLLEGSFNADSIDSDPADCDVENTLPVSLRSASGVDLVLCGLHEGSGDFVTIRVHANSLTLQALGEPQTLQHTRASI